MLLLSLVIVILAAKRIIAIATTATAVRAFVIACETNNRDDTFMMCAVEMTHHRLK